MKEIYHQKLLKIQLKWIFSGVWLSSFNSTANPFVYALLMPIYRKCVRKTFCACVTGSTKRKNCQGREFLRTISSDISMTPSESSHKTSDCNTVPSQSHTRPYSPFSPVPAIMTADLSETFCSCYIISGWYTSKQSV